MAQQLAAMVMVLSLFVIDAGASGSLLPIEFEPVVMRLTAYGDYFGTETLMRIIVGVIGVLMALSFACGALIGHAIGMRREKKEKQFEETLWPDKQGKKNLKVEKVDKQVQSQCTYSAVRGVAAPKFEFLRRGEDGVSV